jgi:PTH1 family peptidyl-tRNA hydrolase
MASVISLIAGLGNPGPRYEDTRHNAGFWFVEELANRFHGTWREESRFKARVCEINVDGRRVWLLQPQDFMNHSGASIAPFARYYRIEPNQILVAHDELDIPPGRLKLKLGGGAAGHNGLRDTTTQLGSPDYQRLRIGIGHPGKASAVTGFVLKRPPEAEQTLIMSAINHAADHISDIINGNMQLAMTALHSHQG